MSNLKVPLEALSHQFRRTQKILSRDMNSIKEKISAEDISQDDLEDISLKLQYLVELVESSDLMEKRQLASLEARITESQQILCPARARSSSAEDSKIIVMIADALLRRGLFNAVNALIADTGDWLRHHTDSQIYQSAAVVESAILAGDMETPLQWCTDHASKLRRLNSAMTFFVRQEQFLDMVYVGKPIEALRFAQEHLAPLVMDSPDDSTNTPSSSRRPAEQEAESISAANNAAAGTATGDTNGRSVSSGDPLRQRAVSMGSTPTSPVDGGGGGSSAATAAGTRTSSSSSLSGHDRLSTPRPAVAPSIIPSVPSFSPGFSFPFSLSSNPLAFFQHAHTVAPLRDRSARSGGTQVDTHSRSVGRPGSVDRAASGGSQLQRNRSASVSSVAGTSASVTPHDRAVTSPGSIIHDEIEIDGVQQSAFLKEALCHLMSMLAFMQTGNSASTTVSASALSDTCVKTPARDGGLPSATYAGASISTPTPWTASSLFGSMVPHMYDQTHTAHRRRCIVDLFRLECRRVYSLPRVCALERLVQMGMFSLKTPSCGEVSTHNESSNGNSSRQSRISFGSVSVISGPAGPHSSNSSNSTSTSTGSGNNLSNGEGSVDISPALGIGGSDINQTTVGQQQRPLSQHVASSVSAHPSAAFDTRETTQGTKLPPSSLSASGTSYLPVNREGIEVKSASQSNMRSCPVCSRPGQIISHAMPCPLRTGSRLRCRGTGEVMDHENPAMALPNGQVYSRAFIMSNAFPCVHRKRKSRYLSVSPTLPSHYPATDQSLSPMTSSSTTTAPANTTDRSVEVEVADSDVGSDAAYSGLTRYQNDHHAAAIDLLLNFRRVRLERGRMLQQVHDEARMEVAMEEGLDTTGSWPCEFATGTSSVGTPEEKRSGAAESDSMDEELQYQQRQQQQLQLEQSKEEVGHIRRDWDPLIHSHTQPKLRFTCPVTQQTFDVDQIRPVYIV